MNSVVLYTLVAISIAFAWVIYSRWRREQTEVLRDRVTFMLWTAAEECELKKQRRLQDEIAGVDLTESFFMANEPAKR